MDINGDADGPPTKMGFYIGDLVTPLFAGYSILAASRQKERTGQGQHLDVSMMDTLTAMMFMENLEEDLEAGTPLRTGNISRSGPTGLYHASDAEIIITAASDDQWRRLTVALEAPELLEDPKFESYHKRTINVEQARQEIQQRVGLLTRQQALERLERADVPCGPERGGGNRRSALLRPGHSAAHAPRGVGRADARIRVGISDDLLGRTPA